MQLLTKSSAKIDKSQNGEWLNAVMYLEPDYNKQVCLAASPSCKANCLKNSGRMAMSNAVNARYNRTELYFKRPELFTMLLKGEIAALLYQAEKEGKRLAMRLNGTSDIDWTSIYEVFPEVQFYEYTKRPDLINKNSLDNVHFTFSRTENTKDSTIARMIKKGVNVSVVFGQRVPSTFKGLPVIDGDKHDRRFEDTKGSVIGLKFKGTNARKQDSIETGFAVTD